MEIVATALACSLGYDAHTACAAARAGLSRPAELPFTMLDNDRSPGLAIGYPAPLLGGGFVGDPRLIRLLEGALRDLAEQLPASLLSSVRVAFYLGIPPSDRERHGLHGLLDDEARARYLERLGSLSEVDEVDRGRRLLGSGLRLAQFPVDASLVTNALRVSVSGHAAVSGLYAQAQHDLASGAVDLAIVGGVDSLVGHETLTWLKATQRLKGAESPAGLAPGEAAALVALGGPAIAARMAHPPRARIGKVVRASSPTQYLAGEPADGKAQAEVIRALTDTIGGYAATEWLIVDQNGEVFRASDWGHSLVRLRAAAGTDTAPPRVWYPAASFGDVGSASGAVATCLAVHGLERSYAPFPHAVIVNSSDGPQRGGCVVSAMES